MERRKNKLKDEEEESSKQTRDFCFTCLVSFSTNNLNCLPLSITHFNSIKFVSGFSGVLHFWPDAAHFSLLQTLPLQLWGKQSLFHTLTIQPPPFIYIYHPLTIPFIQPHASTLVCMCVRLSVLPWEPHHKRFNTFASHLHVSWATGSIWAFDFDSGGELAWPCPFLCPSCSSLISLLAQPSAVSPLSSVSTCHSHVHFTFSVTLSLRLFSCCFENISLSRVKLLFLLPPFLLLTSVTPNQSFFHHSLFSIPVWKKLQLHVFQSVCE